METSLIAYCGLYCQNCFKFKKGKCPGCNKNSKATWCKIRSCNIEKGFASCADCVDPGSRSCKKFNNPIGYVFGLVFNSDREACIQLIKEEGYQGFAKYMQQNNLQTLPRRRK